MAGIYAEIEADDNPEHDETLVALKGDAAKDIADLEFVLQQRALFTSNIHLADQKSGYIAILHGVLISGVSSLMQNNEILTKFSGSVDSRLYVFAIVMLFISFIANMIAFIPRVRRASKDQSWTDLASANVDGFVEFIRNEPHASRIRRMAAQVKMLAQICNEKFAYIRYSIVFLGLSMASSIVLYLRLVLA